MSRRRRIANAESLDSLLDTMANIIGILVVLMAITQIHVDDAMERIQDIARAESDQLRSSEASLATKWLALSPQVEAVAQERDRLRDHRDALAPGFSRADAERARRLDREIGEARARLANLRVEIESESESATIRRVRLPDPRPAPPHAEPFSFLVRYGRVLHADLPKLETLAVRKARRIASRKQYRDVPEAFAAKRVGDANVHWQLRLAGPQTLMAQLVWNDQERGEDGPALAGAASGFRGALEAANPTRHYLVFHVWGDSFSTYLEARRIAEAAGFAVGWVPYDVESEYEGRIPAPGEPNERDSAFPVD